MVRLLVLKWLVYGVWSVVDVDLYSAGEIHKLE